MVISDQQGPGSIPFWQLLYIYLWDESLCIYHPGSLLDVSGRRVRGGERNSPATAAEDGLSKACVCHVEHICPILQGMEMAQHHWAAIGLADLTQLPASSVYKKNSYCLRPQVWCAKLSWSLLEVKFSYIFLQKLLWFMIGYTYMYIYVT